MRERTNSGYKQRVWGWKGRRGERVGKGHGEQVEVQAPHFTFAG